MILGTTDTDYFGSLEDIPVDESDVQYVLGVVNRYFPEARLSPCDIRGKLGGVRPLVGTGRGGPSDISRAHTIRISQPRWVDVAGGKLTTYLLMGEQTVRKVLRAMGRKPRHPDPTEPLFSGGQPPVPVGILPPPPSEGTRPPVLPRGMGRAPGRRHDPSYKLALLPRGHSTPSPTGGRLDGITAWLGCSQTERRAARAIAGCAKTITFPGKTRSLPNRIASGAIRKTTQRALVGRTNLPEDGQALSKTTVC